MRLAPWNWFMPSSKDIFTDCPEAVILLWIIFAIYVLRLSCCLVCSLLPCDHLLGKGWPFGSRLRCLIMFCHLPSIVSWVSPPVPTLWQVTVVLAAWNLHAILTFCASSNSRIQSEHFVPVKCIRVPHWIRLLYVLRRWFCCCWFALPLWDLVIVLCVLCVILFTYLARFEPAWKRYPASQSATRYWLSYQGAPCPF